MPEKTEKRKEMRFPDQVAKQIKEKLPDELKEEMDWYIKDFSFKAPEQIPECFSVLSEKLQEIIREDTNGCLILTKEWHFEVAAILSDKSVEEMKAQYRELL